MNPNLKQYIEAARAEGHSNDQIKKDMVAGGWSETMVQAGLDGKAPLVVPPPPSTGVLPTPQSPASVPAGPPQAVVQSLTTRGLEYTIMFLALGVAALALGSVLHGSVNAIFGSPDSWFSGDETTSFASAALLVSFPIWAFLFFRLKKAELADTNLHNDPSRKRSVQLTLIVTFLIGLGNVIFFVYNLMSGGGNDYDYNAVGSQAASGFGGNLVHLLITLAIAGGIFAYYWIDEHRKA